MDVHAENTPSPTEITLSGTVMRGRDVQDWKTKDPRLERLLGRTTAVRLEHEANALSPKAMTPLGNTTSCSDVSAKALLSILVKLSGSMMPVMAH